MQQTMQPRQAAQKSAEQKILSIPKSAGSCCNTVHWLVMPRPTVARQQASSAASAANIGGGAAGLQGCRSTARRMPRHAHMNSPGVAAASRAATRSV